MLQQIKWENLYELWRIGSYQFPEVLTDPVFAETVSVEYKQTGYIYGYDWLENNQVDDRKQLIKKSPTEFLWLHATISDSELRRTATGNCLLCGLTGSLCRHAGSA